MKPKFSFSQIDLYLRCPKAFEFCYVKKIPQKFSIYAHFGSVIHNVLQKFLELKKENLEAPQLFGDLFGDPEKNYSDDSLEKLFEIFNEKFNRENFGDEAEDFFERGKKILENFFYQEKKSYDDKKTPFLIEKKFQIDFGDFLINGRFDRVDKIGENSYEIIDYKTGKLRDKNQVKEDLQLGLYCIALQKNGLKPEKAHLYFLDHGEKFYFEINEENLEKSKKTCKEFFENLNKKKFPAKPEISKCKHCSYKKYCEFRKSE